MLGPRIEGTRLSCERQRSEKDIPLQLFALSDLLVVLWGNTRTLSSTRYARKPQHYSLRGQSRFPGIVAVWDEQFALTALDARSVGPKKKKRLHGWQGGSGWSCRVGSRHLAVCNAQQLVAPGKKNSDTGN
jgi:hypothetical protein